MGLVNFFLGPGMFLAPLIYVPLYLYVERAFSDQLRVQFVLKLITVLGGLFLIVYACTATLDYNVPIPSGGTARNEVPASLFLAILGAAQMTLPLYSKYIKFTNPDE